MSQIYFNKQNKIECPTLVLQNKSNHSYGAIVDYNSLTYKQSFNAPNEISFTVYKPKHMSEQQKKIWDNLVDLKVVYIPEFNEKFEISIQKTISNTKTKAVTGTALAEAELSQILLRNIEINTELDIENDKYDVNFRTVFYRDIDDINNEKYIEIWDSDKKYTVYDENGDIDPEKTIELRRGILYSSSLLHRLLDKAVNYSIDYVDESLKNLNLIKSFSISNQYIYNELVGEISEEYGVLFKFDSINRTVSAYDLYNTCYDCGYRDDFTEECPKCGSRDIGGQYGVSTPILVSAENLATQLTKNGDSGSVKTYFKVEGGDDLINSVIAAINPTGNAYIFYLPDYMLEEMPQGMRDRMDSYNQLKNKFVNDNTDDDHVNFLEEEGFSLSAENVDNYNAIVIWLSKHDEDDEFSLIGPEPEGKLNFTYNPMIGYGSTTKLYYDLVELESVLRTSLMPTSKTDEQTLTEAFDLITEAFHPLDESEKVTVAVSNLKSVGDTSVDNAVIGVVEVVINTALFDSEIVTSTYDKNTATWTGTIRLTNKETLEDEKPETMERSYTLDITDNVLEYTKQKIKKNMARTDINEIQDLTSLDEKTYSGEPVIIHGVSYKSWLEWFQKELEYYSADNLEQLVTEFEACRSVIVELQDELDEGCETDEKNGHLIGYEKKPSDHFYSIYTNRLELIKAELANKENMLNQLYKLYKYDSSTNYSTGEVPVIRRKVNSLLDFQKCMEGSGNEENYWTIFCSYLREDTYTNENYISTDLSVSQQIDRANELMEVAYREIQKSAYNQYTISSTMNNLFALKEFQPFKDYFDVGNWIRVDVDDEIHKLRLLSYQINFDELQEIDVEFSSVVHSPSYISDIKSVFNSVSNISSSYDAVTKQVSMTSELLDDISGRLENGLDSSTTKIVNDGLVEEIIIDKNGILGRAYDDITGEYDNCQYKFIRNGLYMTKDSWKSIYNAIGRFRYDTGKTETVGSETRKVYETAYGIKADTIVGNLIFGKQLVIRNEGNSFKVDENGLFIEDSQHRSAVTINPNDEEGILFRVSSGYKGTEYTENIMYVDKEGNGHFKGAIEAETGIIASYKIDGETLSSRRSIFNGLTNTSQYVYCYDSNGNQVELPDGSGEGKTVTLYGNRGKISSMLPGEIKIDGWDKSYYYEKLNDSCHLGYNAYTYYANTIDTKICLEEKVYDGDIRTQEAIKSDPIESNNYSEYAKSVISSRGITFEENFKEAKYMSELSGAGLQFYDQDFITVLTNISSYGISVKGENGITVNGTKVSLEGHTHSEYATTNELSVVHQNILEKIQNEYLHVNGGTVGKLTVSGALVNTGIEATQNAANVRIGDKGKFLKSTSSSRRYKHDITDISSDLSAKKLLSLPVVQYVYNTELLEKADTRFNKPVPGFIAEDVEEIYPIAADYKNGQVEDWNYRFIIPPMLKLIQDAYKEIDNLKEEIRLLKESRGE